MFIWKTAGLSSAMPSSVAVGVSITASRPISIPAATVAVGESMGPTITRTRS